MSTKTSSHILVYPFTSSGHLIPTLDLTSRLLSRGLTVTVIVIPKDLPLLNSFNTSSLQTLVLPEPELPPPTTKNGIACWLRGWRDVHYPLIINWFRSHESPPVAILADYFLGWAQHLATELGIKHIVFSPSGVFSYAAAVELWLDVPRNNDPGNMDFSVSLPKIPNSPKCPWWQIPHPYKDYESGDPDSENLRESWLAVFSSWGIVFNSFSELEPVYIDYMKTKLGHQRIWAVGPVLSLDDDLAGQANRGGSSSVPFDEVLAWLDSMKEKSVLYISFGSVMTLTVKQMRLLASSLELCGVPFVWCVRNPFNNQQVADDYGTILKELEDRVEKGRGFVIKGWAPQLAILRHKAVGALLTNCGWNSALEGLAAGVLLLTWPMMADQYTNSELVIDQLGLGIRVAAGERELPEASELARILDESMKDDVPERVKVRHINEAAVKAVKGGSSGKDLDELVKSLDELSFAADNGRVAAA